MKLTSRLGDERPHAIHQPFEEAPFNELPRLARPTSPERDQRPVDVQRIGALVSQAGGAALLIDYGRDRPGFGDTLQALQRHEKVHPLASPGEADLTVHADFPAVMAAAERAGAATAILTQALFLARMGVGERAEALIRVRPDKAHVIGRQLHRLVGGDQMGDLFKACCLHAPDWTPPAFEED